MASHCFALRCISGNCMTLFLLSNDMHCAAVRSISYMHCKAKLTCMRTYMYTRVVRPAWLRSLHKDLQTTIVSVAKARTESGGHLEKHCSSEGQAAHPGLGWDSDKGCQAKAQDAHCLLPTAHASLGMQNDTASLPGCMPASQYTKRPSSPMQACAHCIQSSLTVVTQAFEQVLTGECSRLHHPA